MTLLANRMGDLDNCMSLAACPVWKCHQCGDEFYQEGVMLAHLKSKHGKNPVNVDFEAGEMREGTA